MAIVSIRIVIDICTLFYGTVFYGLGYYTVLHSILLHYITLHFISLYCKVFFCFYCFFDDTIFLPCLAFIKAIWYLIWMDRIDVINSSILKMIDCDIRCTLLYFTVLRSTVSHFLNLFFSLHFCISLCRIVSTVQTIMYNIIRAVQYRTCCAVQYFIWRY